ncbi:MAG: hypothetical protein R3A10_16110 [Caldilineaceae bacterium]
MKLGGVVGRAVASSFHAEVTRCTSMTVASPFHDVPSLGQDGELRGEVTDAPEASRQAELNQQLTGTVAAAAFHPAASTDCCRSWWNWSRY